MPPLPVIICGRNVNIAKTVKELLQPEYEVIHVVMSPEQGVAELPLLLDGKPVSAPDNPGTRNYSRLPVAVFVGGGYDDEGFNMMRNACKASRGVPWLRHDRSIPGGPPVEDIAAYAAYSVGRLKDKLDELKLDEEVEDEKKKVHYF